MNPDSFPPAIRDAVDKMVARSTETLEGSLSDALTGLLAFLGYLPWLVLIPILAFFLLKDADDFREAQHCALFLSVTYAGVGPSCSKRSITPSPLISAPRCWVVC